MLLLFKSYPRIDDHVVISRKLQYIGTIPLKMIPMHAGNIESFSTKTL